MAANFPQNCYLSHNFVILWCFFLFQLSNPTFWGSGNLFMSFKKTSNHWKWPCIYQKPALRLKSKMAASFVQNHYLSHNFLILWCSYVFVVSTSMFWGSDNLFMPFKIALNHRVWPGIHQNPAKGQNPRWPPVSPKTAIWATTLLSFCGVFTYLWSLTPCFWFQAICLCL